jgi:hypothetical protein
MSCLIFVTKQSYLLFLELLVYFKCYFVSPKQRHSTDDYRIKRTVISSCVHLLAQFHVQQRVEYE